MKTLNSLSARVAIPGSCLIAALAAGCSFDASQLRTLAASAPDGAAEPVAGASGSGGNTASPPDAPAVTGGSGGMAASPPDAPIATGGSGGTAAGPFDAPAPPIQDAQVTTTLDMGSVQDAPPELVPDAAAGLSSDGSPDRAPDVGQDIAPDSATDLPSGPCVPPAVPTGVKATAGISRVTVSWTASTGSPTSYEVKRATSSGGPFASLGTVTASPYVDSAVTNGITYYYVVASRNANGVCSSANSGSSSTAPRSCTVWSGNAVSAGHPPAIGTVNGICYVTCDTITNWGCASINGDRTITINGGPLGCGGYPIPAPKTAGYNVIDVTAGTSTAAQLFWGGTWVNNCSIPAGGLDF